MWLVTLLFIALVLCGRRFIFKTIILLHMFQLEGYKNKRFIKWAIKNPKRTFDGICIIRCKKPYKKKPLVWTGRAKRLFSLSILLWFFTLGIIFYLCNLPIVFLFSYIAIQLVFIYLVLSNILLSPLQKSINLYYFIMAKRKLRTIRPKVIAIAGSYGKTSVKHIIGKILSKTYNTLITQESYNTLMGVCRVINERLKKEHQIFVVEIGAYKRGDIREVCRLVEPEIGVLTGITIQHLERFKTLENIKLAKFEIIENLPPDGVAIVNNDDEHCRELMKGVKIKSKRYGVEERTKVREDRRQKTEHRTQKTEGRTQNIEDRTQNTEDRTKDTEQRTKNTEQRTKDTEERASDVIAQDIEIDENGTRFTVFETSFKTRLLGRHNVLNILAGICVGLELSIDIEKIKEAIKELDFIPHRLQLIKTKDNVFILDDSYNSNPIGAFEALSSLSLFKDKRKILVTPGMIELGRSEEIENKRFGKKAASICNIVILVGEKRTRSIFEGLKEGGFPNEDVIVVDSLESAKEKLKMIIKPNDCVLFENDLPDTYI